MPPRPPRRVKYVLAESGNTPCRGFGTDRLCLTKDFLAKEGYQPDMGARPLRRAVQKYIEDPLSEEILFGRFSEGDTILVDLDETGQILFKKAAGADGSAPREEESAVKN